MLTMEYKYQKLARVITTYLHFIRIFKNKTSFLCINGDHVHFLRINLMFYWNHVYLRGMFWKFCYLLPGHNGDK